MASKMAAIIGKGARCIATDHNNNMPRPDTDKTHKINFSTKINKLILGKHRHSLVAFF